MTDQEIQALKDKFKASPILQGFNAPATLAKFQNIKIEGMETYAELMQGTTKKRILDFWKVGEGYYKKKYISASFITHVLNCTSFESVYYSVNEKQKLKNFAFGHCFESACFGINTLHYELREEDYNKIGKMVEVFKPYLPAEFERDIEVFGEYEYKGCVLKIKGKLDLKTTNKIVDIKTTTSTTLKAFLTACETYGYFTQGFIYSYLCHNKPFGLLACSKKELVKDGHRVLEFDFLPEHFNKGKERFEKSLDILENYGLLGIFC